MSINVEQLIQILQKCHPDAIVSIMDGDLTVETELKFIEFCPVSNTVFLQVQKPELVDSDYLSIEILAQEEHFAKTKYYDVEGVAY
jgi:hypothetical protein